MAATILEYRVDEVTNADASPVVRNSPGRINSNLKIFQFYWKPTVAIAATSDIALAKLPTGFTCLGGKLVSNAWVATSTASVGLMGVDGTGFYDKAGTISDNTSLFGNSLAVATAGVYDFGNTSSLNYGLKLDKECYLTMLLVAAGLDGSADIVQGYIMGTIN
jgi:hypothetical protein